MHTHISPANAERGAKGSLHCSYGRAFCPNLFSLSPLNLSPMALRLGIAVPCPVTEDISKRLVRLPLFSSLTVAQQSHVIEMAKSFFTYRVAE